MKMGKRLAMAWSKLLFCCKTSHTPGALLLLLLNTKRLAWAGNSVTPPTDETPALYSLLLQGAVRRMALRCYHGDLTIFYDVWWRRIYELPAGVLHNATIIVDLGAHVGMTSLFFSLGAPQAVIYAVEADGHNIDLLRRNLAPEICTHKLIPFHAAIHANNELVYLQKTALSYNTRISPLPTNYQVQGITISQLIATCRIDHIDVLKVDIEGAEAFLLEEADKWLPITRHILVELHNDDLVQQFTEVIKPYGFRLEKRSFDHECVYWASLPCPSYPPR